MRTFLLTWIEKRWQWKTLAKDAARVQSGERVSDTWSSGNRKDIEKGDRLFLLKQGAHPKGIIGSGWAMGECFRALHWDNSRASQGDQANYIPMIFEHLVHPDDGEVLPFSVLRFGKLASVNWNTQASGIVIEEDAAHELEQLWAQHRGSAAEIDDEVSVLEGERRLRLIAHRKRERALRDAKIAAALRAQNGRLQCEVPRCEFDFYQVYGETGRGYAQVHHLEPIGKRSVPSSTSLKQLIVVCGNCHAMIHRGGECREIRDLIPRTRKRAKSH
jgi:5-methylcytosine-specific restriction endonuclease McrA